MIDCQKVDTSFVITIMPQNDDDYALLDHIKKVMDHSKTREEERKKWSLKPQVEVKQMTLSDLDASFKMPSAEEFHTMTAKETEECPFV